jgi:hypothetical protein
MEMDEEDINHVACVRSGDVFLIRLRIVTIIG